MKKIAVLLSGGIDSLVAARRLIDQGHPVVGIHFVTGYEQMRPDKTTAVSHCHAATGDGGPQSPAAKIVEHLADQLKIPVSVFDCRQAFKTRVVDYFIRTYQAGKTPSPCLVCNPAIKFDAALSFARELDATHIATGHYACVQADDSGRVHLFRGRDRHKDQSYFLARLNQKALASALFPLCDMTKAETIRTARLKHLVPLVSQESQDICFIKEGHYGDFLKRQPGFQAEPGLIEDSSGNIIGKHSGLYGFTVGQRRGINCPAAEPYYVLKIDAERNRLIVGFKKENYSQTCRVDDMHWIHQVPDQPFGAHTRIRYRHQAAASTITPIGLRSATVRFETPQNAVTPGQAAVFYNGDEVLGSGWIAA